MNESQADHWLLSAEILVRNTNPTDLVRLIAGLMKNLDDRERQLERMLTVAEAQRLKAGSNKAEESE